MFFDLLDSVVVVLSFLVVVVFVLFKDFLVFIFIANVLEVVSITTIFIIGGVSIIVFVVILIAFTFVIFTIVTFTLFINVIFPIFVIVFQQLIVNSIFLFHADSRELFGYRWFPFQKREVFVEFRFDGWDLLCLVNENPKLFGYQEFFFRMMGVVVMMVPKIVFKIVKIDY